MSAPHLNLRTIFQRVWPLLSAAERKQAGGMLVLAFFNSFAEILGLAAVLPVISVVVNPELIHENRYLRAAHEAASGIGIESDTQFIALLTGVMLAGFLFKGGFGLFVTLMQNRFSLSVGHRISGEMWTNHFTNSLERLRAQQSGHIQATINGWPINFANAFITGGLALINEFVVVSLIALGLLAYQPLILLGIAALLGVGFVIIRTATRRKLALYSDALKRLEPHSISLITNALRGFLEVITFRASDAVRDAYLDARRDIFRINAHRNVMLQMPAKLYEVLAVLVIAVAIFASLLLKTNSGEFFELLTLLVLSAYRVMPSMSRMNGFVMNMRGNAHVLEEMEEGIRGARSQRNQQKEASVVDAERFTIACNKLTLGYEALPEPVFAGLDVRFEPGKVHAIVGASGSGKSTLISALLGLHAPTAGTISITSETAAWSLGNELHHRDWLAHVGYLSQAPFLFAGTLRDNLTLRVPGMTVNEARTLELIDRLGLNDCLGDAPLDFELNEGGSNLSGGQQQRVALLRALQVQRAVLILDEATSALDTDTRDRVFELLQERAAEGCNVILVTHDRDIAGRCDDCLELDQLA